MSSPDEEELDGSFATTVGHCEIETGHKLHASIPMAICWPVGLHVVLQHHLHGLGKLNVSKPQNHGLAGIFLRVYYHEQVLCLIARSCHTHIVDLRLASEATIIYTSTSGIFDLPFYAIGRRVAPCP